jgi:hypothetical protein
MLSSDFVPVLASIASEMRSEDWERLSADVADAPLHPALAEDEPRLAEIRSALVLTAPNLPDRIQPAWNALREKLVATQSDAMPGN